MEHARVVARHFETDHHEIVIKPDAVASLPRLVCTFYNEPSPIRRRCRRWPSGAARDW